MKSINWKEAHDLQQKLVISYTLENEKLKDRIKKLEAPSESVNEICKQIEEIYRDNENLKLKCHVLETANDELDAEIKKLKKEIREVEELKQAVWRRK